MATVLRRTLPAIAALCAAINVNRKARITTDASLRVTERLVPAAPATQIHASMASGAALNVTTAFTRILPATNIRLSRGGAGVATVYTVTGTRFGQTQTETINSNGASDVEGVKIFDTVTSITSNVDPTVTTTMKAGVIVGLAAVAAAIDFLAVGTSDVNGVVEAATLNAAKDGFTPTTAPDAAKIFQVRYSTGTAAKLHFDASEATIALANASDLDTSVALVNQIAQVLYGTYAGTAQPYPGHLLDLLAHVATDTTNVRAAPKATNLATAITLANEIKADFTAHLTQSGVHLNPDATNTIAASDATDQSSLNTLLNELKSDINAHMADAAAGASLRAVDL